MIRCSLLLMIVLIAGCSKNKQINPELVGKWQRVETYISPGGASSWQPTNDNPKVNLELTASGNVSSNHLPYATFTRYQQVGKDSIMFRTINGQEQFNSYTIENDKLTIWFSCIEGCGDRFVRKD